MRFLVDRCAGHRLAEFLRSEGHDVVESRDFGPDPGDSVLLAKAAELDRIFVTMDKDFGAMLFVDRAEHRGLVRLPDVPAQRRIELMREVLDQHAAALENRSVVTVRGGRIRISVTTG